MKLDEIEKIIAAATPGPWTCGYTPITEHTHWQSHGPVTFGMKQAVSDAAFIAASRELMPKLLKLAHTSISLDLLFYSGSNVVMSRQLDAWRTAMAELEQP